MNSSQDTYLSHLAQYYIWCEDHDQDFWTVPTPYFLVACWIIDSITRGITAGTIIGYKSAIKWFNDILGYVDSSGGGWTSKHTILSRLSQYASNHQVGLADNSALDINQAQIKWLWYKYINGIYNDRVKVISYVLGIILGARPNWLWKVSNKLKGIRIKHVIFLFKKKDVHLWKKYGIRLPMEHWEKVQAVKFLVPNAKAKAQGSLLVRYAGRTKVKGYDPVFEFVKIVANQHTMMIVKQEDYIFRSHNGKPLHYDAMFRWVIKWRPGLSGYGKEQWVRVRLHTIRKAFGNLSFRSGMDMLQIATYGTWALPTALIVYVNYDRNFALGLAYRLLIKPQKASLKDKSIDMNKVGFKPKQAK